MASRRAEALGTELGVGSLGNNDELLGTAAVLLLARDASFPYLRLFEGNACLHFTRVAVYVRQPPIISYVRNDVVEACDTYLANIGAGNSTLADSAIDATMAESPTQTAPNALWHICESRGGQPHKRMLDPASSAVVGPMPPNQMIDTWIYSRRNSTTSDMPVTSDCAEDSDNDHPW